jgi:UDP-glucose 4-epimerase
VAIGQLTTVRRQREHLRGVGVFERFAVDAIEPVVSLFEMFAREQFEQRAGDSADLVASGHEADATLAWLIARLKKLIEKG